MNLDLAEFLNSIAEFTVGGFGIVLFAALMRSYKRKWESEHDENSGRIRASSWPDDGRWFK